MKLSWKIKSTCINPQRKENLGPAETFINQGQDFFLPTNLIQEGKRIHSASILIGRVMHQAGETRKA